LTGVGQRQQQDANAAASRIGCDLDRARRAAAFDRDATPT
jgi:hypothetical protein